MTKKEVQIWCNKFTDKYLKGVKRLKVDGRHGPETLIRIETVKYYMGFGASRKAPDSKVTPYFERCLRSPKGAFIPRKTRLVGARRRAAQRARATNYIPGRFRSTLYSGCRGVTDKVIAIVNGRYTVSSRKRWQTYGNPGSDHYAGNLRADAVDFRTANNQRLMDEVARRLGGPNDVRDYQNFFITHNGKRYRVQIIAVTHGTGPHMHVGVRRV